MSRVRLLSIALVVLTVTSLVPGGAVAANWQPGPGDWTHFRRSSDHGGVTPAQGAFPGARPDALTDIRVRWQTAADPGFWVPPVAADLNRDGIAEIVATVGNASADPTNPGDPVHLESGVNVLNGATGAENWHVGPTTGDLVFFSPALGDIDGDGNGDIVWFQGNPLTGSTLTNKVQAYSHTGTQKWTWSDTNWPAGKVPETLSGLSIGNVDGESARNEVVLNLLFATVVTTISGGKVVITGSNPEFKVIALNGEGAPQISWQRPYAHGSVSVPAVADLDGDGVGDVVFGSGIKPGTAISTASADIVLSGDWGDDRIKALRGSASPSEILNHQAAGFFPGDLATTPVVADLDQDGAPEVIQPLWVRNVPPTAADTAQVRAINRDGSLKWTHSFGAAIFAPIAVGDLDADGKPDVVVQTDNGGAADKHRVIALKHDGSELWRAASTGRVMSGVPAIGDITGDGRPEVATMVTPPSGGTADLLVLNGQDGTQVWRRPMGRVLSTGGPLLVDLDGDDDGRMEIVVNEGAWGSPGKLYALEPELPDLVVSNLTFSRTQHAYGVTETISATVTNQGTRAANNAVFEVFENDAVLDTQTLTLAPATSQVVQTSWTPQTLGSRTIQAIADRTKQIPEFAENNNRQSSTISVRAPDLTFTAGDPRFSDDSPAEGDTITVTATLRNTGGADAANVHVRFLDQGTTFAEPVVASLAPGASTDVSASLTIVGGQPHTITVKADPDGAIVEEDEGNNAASRTLVVVAPDLTFTAGDPRFSNESPAEGDTITVTVTLRNTGGADARDARVRFLDQGTTFAEPVVSLLAAGASTDLSAPLTIVGEFVHTITVSADPDDTISESDETNNVFSRNLQVRFAAPDLTFAAGDPRFSDELPSDGDTITVTASLRNVGDRNAANVLVRFLDGGTQFAERTVASVPQSGSVDVSAPLLVVGEFVHTVTVIADPANAIIERDEDNNTAERTFRVRIPDLSIAGISFDDPNPDDTGTLTATVRVRNDGGDIGRTVRDVRVDLFDEGAFAGSTVVPSIADQATVGAPISYVVQGVGPHSLKAVVDPLGAIHEQDETNNEGTGSIVVGKVKPIVTMGKPSFSPTEQASGSVKLEFNRTGAPLADKEFQLAVEYVLRAPVDSPSQVQDLVNAAGALLVQLGAENSQHLHACVVERCVDLTLDGSPAIRQLLGAGGQGGTSGLEMTFRLFTLDLRTDRNGVAGFQVPFSMLGAADALRGSFSGRLCLTGMQDVWDTLGQPDPGCQVQAGSIPTLPSQSNLPGRYRATALVDWYGYAFSGRAEYTHT